MTLKSFAVTYSSTPPTCQLVDREIAGDRQRALVVVEHRDVVDVDLVGLQIDLPLQVRVADAGRLDGERRLVDGDHAGRMRIGRGAGDVDLRLQRAGDVGQRGREALHQAEIDRRAVDVQIDAIARRRSARRAPAARLPRSRRLEQRDRHVALRRQVGRRVLLQLGVEREAGARVVHGAAERVVAELLEAALVDAEAPRSRPARPVVPLTMRRRR